MLAKSPRDEDSWGLGDVFEGATAFARDVIGDTAKATDKLATGVRSETIAHVASAAFDTIVDQTSRCPEVKIAKQIVAQHEEVLDIVGDVAKRACEKVEQALRSVDVGPKEILDQMKAPPKTIFDTGIVRAGLELAGVDETKAVVADSVLRSVASSAMEYTNPVTMMNRQIAGVASDILELATSEARRDKLVGNIERFTDPQRIVEDVSSLRVGEQLEFKGKTGLSAYEGGGGGLAFEGVVQIDKKHDGQYSIAFSPKIEVLAGLGAGSEAVDKKIAANVLSETWGDIKLDIKGDKAAQAVGQIVSGEASVGETLSSLWDSIEVTGVGVNGAVGANAEADLGLVDGEVKSIIKGNQSISKTGRRWGCHEHSDRVHE